ncbi:MAG: M24 family metallopeptidase [Planctomycetota bacterium]
MSLIPPLPLFLAAVFSLAVLPAAFAQDPGLILPMRDRAEVIDRWLGERFERLVPELMREHDIDMWVIIGREYNEDPVLRTMLPATWLNARRRTILVFYDPGPGSPIEKLAVARYSVGEHFEAAWDPDTEPNQWARLVELVETRDPDRIGINTSSLFAHADGISHTEHEALLAALPESLHDRIVSAQPLAVGWLETRLPEEMDVYASMCRIAHEIMSEALSEEVIQPGVTTTDDVKWWARERILELGLATWFHPLVSIQRSESTTDLLAMVSGGEQVIQRGDLIHMDLGITYLRLNTDTQQMAYVLRRGETEAPAGLLRAFARGNEMQDILTERFAEGRTGNEVLLSSLAEARRRGIDAMVYTHPLGLHGHAAGPAIGMWDKQGGVPGTGDETIRNWTCYAIELSITEPIAEWGNQRVRIMMEEDALFQGGTVSYIDGRQTELHIVR